MDVSLIRQNKINDEHEKALRIVYSDYKATFEELLDKDTSLSVPHRNMEALAMEIYKPYWAFASNYGGSFQN